MKKLLQANTGYGTRRISQVFSDFCELTALFFRNAVDQRGYDDRNDRYMHIMSGYTSEEANRFSEVLAKLVEEFEAGFSDVLGKLYMSLDLGNGHLGQFFTPYEVSALIAQMTIGDFTERLDEAKRAGRGFITVNEPTFGSGGMIIALAEALKGAGVNYQQTMHVTAQDLEITAIHMTYIQLTLLHIPAAVIHGNTLTLEQRDVWYTPAHILGGWSGRLNNRGAAGAPLSNEAESPARDADVTYIGQYLFDIEGTKSA